MRTQRFAYIYRTRTLRKTAGLSTSGCCLKQKPAARHSTPVVQARISRLNIYHEHTYHASQITCMS